MNQATAPGIAQPGATPSGEAKNGEPQKIEKVQPKQPETVPVELKNVVEQIKPEKLTEKPAIKVEIYKKTYFDVLTTVLKWRNDGNLPPNFDESLFGQVLSLYEAENGLIKKGESLDQAKVDAFFASNQDKKILLGKKLIEVIGSAEAMAAKIVYDIDQQGRSPEKPPPNLKGRKITVNQKTNEVTFEDSRVNKKILQFKGFKDFWKRTYLDEGHEAVMTFQVGDQITISDVGDATMEQYLKEMQFDQINLQEDEGVAYLLGSFRAVVDARADLHFKTGGTIEDFNPNFIIANPNNIYTYINRGASNIKGEKGFTNTGSTLVYHYDLSPRGIALEASESRSINAITTSIRTDIAKGTEKKLAEGDKQTNIESTHLQLQIKRDELAAEIEAKTKGEEKSGDVLKLELERDLLDSELKLIDRSMTIQAEKVKNQREIDQNKKDLDRQNRLLRAKYSDPSIDIEKLDGNANEPTSWRKQESEIKKLETRKADIEGYKTDYAEQIRILREERSQLKDTFTEVTYRDDGTPLNSVFTQDGKDEYTRITKEINAIQTTVDTLNKDLFGDNATGISSIQTRINEATAEQTRIQALLAEGESKTILEKKATFENAEQSLSIDEADINSQITLVRQKYLSVGSDSQIATEIRRLIREKQKSIDRLGKNTTLELDAIDLLLPAFTSEENNKMEERVTEWEIQIIAGAKVDVLKEDPRFASYTETEKQIMRLIFGRNIFTPVAVEGKTNAKVLEITNRALSLLENTEYKTAIDSIIPAGGLLKDINHETIEKALEAMRKVALQIP
jgi:hypothetical protein